MSDKFISCKFPTLAEPAQVHVGTSSTAADYFEIRIHDLTTPVSKQQIVEFLRMVEKFIIQGKVHGTKFNYL